MSEILRSSRNPSDSDLCLRPSALRRRPSTPCGNPPALRRRPSALRRRHSALRRRPSVLRQRSSPLLYVGTLLLYVGDPPLYVRSLPLHMEISDPVRSSAVMRRPSALVWSSSPLRRWPSAQGRSRLMATVPQSSLAWPHPRAESGGFARGCGHARLTPEVRCDRQTDTVTTVGFAAHEHRGFCYRKQLFETVITHRH